MLQSDSDRTETPLSRRRPPALLGVESDIDDGVLSIVDGRNRRAEMLCSDVDVDEHRLRVARYGGVAVGGKHRAELVRTDDEFRDRFVGLAKARGPDQRRVVGAEVREDVPEATLGERPKHRLGDCTVVSSVGVVRGDHMRSGVTYGPSRVGRVQGTQSEDESVYNE